MIIYKGKPLLGEDSSVSNTSEFFAIAGTILFWLIFLIFSFVVKPQPKKQYKEVQIVLSSTPLVQKTDDAPAPAEVASASAQSTQSQLVEERPAPEPVQKTVENPAANKAETQKPGTKKTDSVKTKSKQPSTVAPTPIYKSNEELLEEQLRNKKTRDDNYDPWANETDEVEIQNDEKRNVVKGQNTIDGIAGDAVDNVSDNRVKSEQKTNETNNTVNYKENFNAIRDTKEIGSSDTGAGKKSEKSKGNNKNSVIWTEGTGERTFYSLDTELSQRAKSSMQVSKPTPFTITFSVDADGNVMPTSIEIKNEFILSDIMQKEMKEKISSWKFGKGSGISKAQFDWILSPGN
jgi:hypothetical protein